MGIAVAVCWLSLAVRKWQQPPWMVPAAFWQRIEPLLAGLNAAGAVDWPTARAGGRSGPRASPR